MGFFKDINITTGTDDKDIRLMIPGPQSHPAFLHAA